MPTTYGKIRDDGAMEVAVDAAQEIDTNDLCFLNTDDARSFSAIVDQTTEPLNQEYAAARFLGVCVRGKQGTSAAGTALIDTNPASEFRHVCPSTTWEVGELVGASEDSGTTVAAQQVEKVTSEHLAIGKCIEKGTSLTTVRWRAFPRVATAAGLNRSANLMANSVASSTAVTAGTVTTFSNASRVVDGTLLKAGDILRIKAAGILTTATGAETTKVDLVVGTEIVATTGAVDGVTADVWRLEADVVVRVAGASGKLLSHGTQALGAPGTIQAYPFCTAELSEDISSGALSVLCQVTNSSTGESILCHAFSVEHIRL